MAPPSTDFVTLCDQDDRWHPTKLERLLERMTDGVELAYSDARVVDEHGAVVHPSYWMRRRNNYTNLGSLLIANTVTGAASLFRRGILDDVLPFPPRLADPFHDHWLSLVALARGEISYVEEPLYDYVQHAEAVIGHSRANRRPRPVRERLRDRLKKPGDGSRIVYFYSWSQLQLFAEVLRLRCSDRMAPAKRRAVTRFLSVDTSTRGLAWLLGRRLRRLWGRNETLDIERYFGKALLRRRAVSLGALGRSRPSRWLPRDQSIPPSPVKEDSGGL
jgi:glycosyltransferase involved in cell wall biosynthesis